MEQGNLTTLVFPSADAHLEVSRPDRTSQSTGATAAERTPLSSSSRVAPAAPFKKGMPSKSMAGLLGPFGSTEPSERSASLAPRRTGPPLDSTAGSQPLRTETRSQMSRLITESRPDGRHDLRGDTRGASAAPSAGAIPSHLPAFLPTVLTWVAQIRQELDTHIMRLLSLNPSRREAIVQHLNRLAGIHSGPLFPTDSVEASASLRKWIEGPRTSAQSTALQIFFEEIALVTLGQAVLLKSWSDRKLATWKAEDLGRLNWALSSLLKQQIPLDREGWQITRPNLYSWYNPSAFIQREIWNGLDTWRLTEDTPGVLASIMKHARQYQPNLPEFHGYDPRFFKAMWEQMAAFGFDAHADLSPLKRKKAAFSPTLRDGTLMHSGPAAVQWMGMESNLFQLILAELALLWQGPCPPPLWANGSGLEVHGREQLSLGLGSPKPTLLNRIAEMEACDLGIVLEERVIRANSRMQEGARFREQAEALPYFKKLKGPGTSLGDLQACVAITKLRPGGLLWWTRDEALRSDDGSETLAFLLEHGKLICEWDFAGMDHALPAAVPLFPKTLYLFCREADLQARLSHRPLRITLQGQIRSHIELPLFFADALTSYFAARDALPLTPRGHWKIHGQVSPNCQKEWAEHWPDPAEFETLQSLEKLRSQSVTLASFTNIRATPAGDSAKENRWSVHPAMKGLWLYADKQGDQPILVASPLPRPGDEAQGTGYLVLLRDENWIAPLRAYFESESVRHWMSHHAERRSDRWVLSEQLLKFLPVPRVLTQALGAEDLHPSGIDGLSLTNLALPAAPAPVPLPTEWQSIAHDVASQPRSVLERLHSLRHDAEGRHIRAHLFIRAAQAMEDLRQTQSRLFSLVGDDGSIRWRLLLDILPKSEHVAVSFHSQIRLVGSLPPHMPIGRISLAKSPTHGVILATESGFHLHIGSENPRVVDILWDQLEGLVHPTWHELLQYLKLPRSMELAETTAADILRSHGEQSLRLAEMRELLVDCSDF